MKLFERANDQGFKGTRGVERFVRILRDRPLVSMPEPDAHRKIQAYDQFFRRPGEVIGDYMSWLLVQGRVSPYFR